MFFFYIKWFIFPLDLFHLMGKVKTGNPDSEKAQVIENVTLKYKVFQFGIFPLDLFHLMGKVKTGNPDSEKAQVIENVILKYKVF